MTKTPEKLLETRFIDLIDETADSQTDELTFSFSSETPVNRNGFNEVLDHDVNSVDLSRLNNSAPFLFNHDMNRPIGRVKRAWIENRKGRATIEWGSSDLAQQLRRDVETGVLRNISVGYTIEKTEEDEEGNMRAMLWQPHELSLVSIPADTNVGIDRSLPTDKPLNERAMPLESYSPDHLYSQKEDEYTKESRNFSIVKAVQGLMLSLIHI